MWHGHTIGLLIGLLLFPKCWADPSTHYRDGVAAAREQAYAQAREAFSRAASEGMNTPTLDYNLGVVSYRLGDYAAANRHFTKLSDDPKWQALAYYNLGLTADAEGQTGEAQRYYRKAHELSDNPKLKALTARRQVKHSIASPSSGFGYLASSGGYDDNVGLVGDTDEFVSDEGDYFVEVIAAGGTRGDPKRGWHANGGIYYRKHIDLKEFDYGAGAVAVEHRRSFGGWSVSAGGQMQLQTVDGNFYANQFSLIAKAENALNERTKLRLWHDSAYVDGMRAYQYLDGWQHELHAELSTTLGENFLRAGYALELNSRDDLTLDDEFFSYSPTRHSMYVGGRRALSKRLRAEAQIDYRVSRYADDNVELDADDVAIAKRRKEDRLILTLRLEYRVSKSWDLFSEYRFNDNDANFATRDYSNHQFMIGIQHSFQAKN